MTFLHYLRTSPQRGREKCAHMEDVHGIMQMTFHHLKKTWLWKSVTLIGDVGVESVLFK